MGVCVIVELGAGEIKMGCQGKIRAVHQFAAQLGGANVGSVLKTQAMFAESFIGDGYGKFARFDGGFSDHECVFAREGFRGEANELHDDLFVHVGLLQRERRLAPNLYGGKRASPHRGGPALILEGCDVCGLQTLGAFGHVEFHGLTFVQRLVSLRLDR